VRALSGECLVNTAPVLVLEHADFEDTACLEGDVGANVLLGGKGECRAGSGDEDNGDGGKAHCGVWNGYDWGE
jgi:hypothetical protein